MSTLIGQPADKSRSNQKSGSTTAPKQDSNRPSRSEETEADDSRDAVDPTPTVDPESSPRRRHSASEDDSGPERLPPGSESEAKEINSSKPGRSRL